MKIRLKHDIIKAAIAIIIVVSLATVAYLGYHRFPIPMSKEGTPTRSPINLTTESDRPVINQPSDMCTSPLVADITIGNLGTPRWNTSNGAVPASITRKQVETQGYTINTPFVPAKMQPILDHRSVETKAFYEAGGKVGSDSIFPQDDFTQVKPGARYIVMFIPTYDQSTQKLDLSYLTAYNAFPVVNGQVILKQQIIEQSQVSQPEERISLGGLESALHACP